MHKPLQVQDHPASLERHENRQRPALKLCFQEINRQTIVLKPLERAAKDLVLT